MTIGLILLTATGLLILFGVGQRVLDRLRLTDVQAVVFIALIIAGGFVPDIPVTDRFSFNIGGALIPLALCVYLWFKADTARERARSLVSAIITAIAVNLLGRYLPADPSELVIDPGWAYGIAAVQAVADILTLVLAVPILRSVMKTVAEAKKEAIV